MQMWSFQVIFIIYQSSVGFPGDVYDDNATHPHKRRYPWGTKIVPVKINIDAIFSTFFSLNNFFE